MISKRTLIPNFWINLFLGLGGRIQFGVHWVSYWFSIATMKNTIKNQKEKSENRSLFFVFRGVLVFGVRDQHTLHARLCAHVILDMSQPRHVVRQCDGITNHCHYIEFGRTVTVTFLELRTMLYACHPGVLHMSIDTIPMWIWLVPLLRNISSKSNELDPKTKGLWKSAIYIYTLIWVNYNDLTTTSPGIIA